MINLAVFVSGSGSDLQRIIDSIKSGYLKNVQIRLVIASRDKIYALERAERENIPTAIFSHKDYKDIADMYEDSLAESKNAKIDYIVLAGYLNILTSNIIAAYRNRIINIHPSLIPKYSGKGYYGMKVHKAVIENREKLSGATVHYVDEGTDTGEIIAQETVPVYENDTPESLQQRVLELEHKLLPATLKKILEQ